MNSLQWCERTMYKIHMFYRSADIDHHCVFIKKRITLMLHIFFLVSDHLKIGIFEDQRTQFNNFLSIPLKNEAFLKESADLQLSKFTIFRRNK